MKLLPPLVNCNSQSFCHFCTAMKLLPDQTVKMKVALNMRRRYVSLKRNTGTIQYKTSTYFIFHFPLLHSEERGSGSKCVGALRLIQTGKLIDSIILDL